MNQLPPPGTEFGAVPRKSKYGDGTFPKYEDRFRLLPRERWKPVSLNRHVERIRRQLNGMCTRNGACTAMEVERSIRNRTPNPELSAEYHYLLRNRWGSGSTLGGSLRDLQNFGTITMEDAGGKQLRMTGEFPDNHEKMAQKNRMLEWVDGNASFDALASGLQFGKPGLAGINWPGGGGHAFAVTELYFDSAGRWVIRGPNSWGEDWGDPPVYSDDELDWLDEIDRDPLTGGFYELTESQCRDFKTFGIWLAGSST